MSITMSSWVSRHALRVPDKLALIFKERRITYADLDRRVHQVAHGLHGLGVRKGDRVAALLLNSAEFLEVLLACTHLGAIFVPLNFRLSAPEVEFIIGDCTPEVLFYHPPFAGLARPLLSRAPVRHLVQVGGQVQAGDGVLLYDTLHEGRQAAGAPALSAEDDPALMMYTSGTTGRPKGALLSHGNLLWNNIQVMLSIPARDEDLNYTVTPMFHIGGLNVLTGPLLYRGATSLIDDKFDPVQTLETLRRERVTCTFMVPAMWGALAQVPGFDSYDLSSLRFCICGGAPCPLPVIEFYMQRGIRFREGFGLTETAPIVCLLAAEDGARKSGSVGMPAMHVEVRLLDEGGHDVQEGGVGELVVRGPNVMLGYWDRPDETAEAFRGGWFHTGDLARRDDEGYLYIVDRMKDMVISGGENVYPIEIEQVLHRHPGIADVAVVGLPDDKWGEAVTAVVVLREGVDLSLAEVQRHCEGKLAHFKQPRRLFAVKALPRNATGKVLKNELRQLFGGSASAVTR